MRDLEGWAMKGRQAGVTYPGDGQYDRGIAPTFGALAKERFDQLGITQVELSGRIGAALGELGHPPSYRETAVGNVLRGQSGLLHLKTWVVEAWCRALEVTDLVEKAKLYLAAGHGSPGITPEQYARQWEARAS